MANVLNSIMNIISSNIFSLEEYAKKYHDSNRMNNMGRALEEFIKDSYADTILSSSEQTRLTKQSEIFDYSGNNSNPPDAMLTNSDAIEIKKIESLASELALNSSYPSHRVYNTSKMLSKDCRKLIDENGRDILYTIGSVNKKEGNSLKYLFLIYGIDYAAKNEIYESIKSTVKEGITSLNNFDFKETNELGRLNDVDPLGRTYLRIRGMWGIKNPVILFQDLISKDFYKSNNHSIVFIVRDEKWNSFDNTDEFVEFASSNNITISNIKIPDPNNRASMKSGKLIVYSI